MYQSTSRLALPPVSVRNTAGSPRCSSVTRHTRERPPTLLGCLSRLSAKCLASSGASSSHLRDTVGGEPAVPGSNHASHARRRRSPRVMKTWPVIPLSRDAHTARRSANVRSYRCAETRSTCSASAPCVLQPVVRGEVGARYAPFGGRRALSLPDRGAHRVTQAIVLACPPSLHESSEPAGVLVGRIERTAGGVPGGDRRRERSIRRNDVLSRREVCGRPLNVPASGRPARARHATHVP